MSGAYHGRVDCLNGVNYAPGAGVTTVVQEIFTNIYYAFLTHPNMTEIARRGNVGFWDEATPFTTNNWFVFRMNTVVENPFYTGTRTFPWYVLVQYSALGSVFGASPGNPGLVDNNQDSSSSPATIGVQFAIGVGGDQNPWNGSGALGSGVKGTPVWSPPSGGSALLVFPRSNNPDGAHVTNKENCTTLVSRSTAENGDTQPALSHIIMDDDSFFFAHSLNANHRYSALYFGEYVPRPGLNPDYPYVMLSSRAHNYPTLYGGFLPLPRYYTMGNRIGTGTGSSSSHGGGGVAVNATDGVRGAIIERYTGVMTDYRFHPNAFFSTRTFDEFPIPLWSWDEPGYNGYLGQVDFIRETCGLETRHRSTGSRYVIAGTTAVNAIQLTMPWPSGVIPGSIVSRTGVAF